MTVTVRVTVLVCVNVFEFFLFTLCYKNLYLSVCCKNIIHSEGQHSILDCGMALCSVLVYMNSKLRTEIFVGVYVSMT